MHDNAVLSVKEMKEAETLAEKSGMKSYDLMKRAGEAVAQIAMERYPGRCFLVLAGPGNNGGDGFVAAQVLLAKGGKVEILAIRDMRKLKGAAAHAAGEYKGKTIPIGQAKLDDDPVIIDALFGTGLSRAISDDAKSLIGNINARHMDVISVDIPSGVQGDSGEVLGVALKAKQTVTFARKKYGHLLMPGRMLCGEVIVTDIGIDDQMIASAAPKVSENMPSLWQSLLPWPKPEHHKYHRGHTLVMGGAAKRAGAAKLAAMAALRTGSGLVSIVCRKTDVPVYAASALSLMTETHDHWQALLTDNRINTIVIGPGAGIGKATRDVVLSALKAKKRVVLDADALTSFAANAKALFSAIKSRCIMTPHTGEFAKLFPRIKGNKLEQALKAAALSAAVIILKGFDTVIASPDGRVAINSNAPPSLATAGAGDVLSGICAGWIAQGMEAFEAGCAAVWVHAEAAKLHGMGLIAEDIPQCLPLVLEKLNNKAML